MKITSWFLGRAKPKIINIFKEKNYFLTFRRINFNFEKWLGSKVVMQGPAKPLYGGSIPPLASNSNEFMFNFYINSENVFFFLVKNKKNVIFSLVLAFILLISFLTFSFYQTKKQAVLSGEIAVGFAYLEEKKLDTALYHFEKAFNKSNGFYKAIAGIGVIKSIPENLSRDEKILNVLNIIKNYSGNMVFKNLILSTFLSNASVFKPDSIKEADIKKFETAVEKINLPYFNEALLNLYLNAKRDQDFEKRIKKSFDEKGDANESTAKFNIKERYYLLKSF